MISERINFQLENLQMQFENLQNKDSGTKEIFNENLNEIQILIEKINNLALSIKKIKNNNKNEENLVKASDLLREKTIQLIKKSVSNNIIKRINIFIRNLIY